MSKVTASGHERSSLGTDSTWPRANGADREDSERNSIVQVEPRSWRRAGPVGSGPHGPTGGRTRERRTAVSREHRLREVSSGSTAYTAVPKSRTMRTGSAVTPRELGAMSSLYRRYSLIPRSCAVPDVPAGRGRRGGTGAIATAPTTRDYLRSGRALSRGGHCPERPESPVVDGFGSGSGRRSPRRAASNRPARYAATISSGAIPAMSSRYRLSIIPPVVGPNGAHGSVRLSAI